MSLTFGFYNSLAGDRKYDAIQLSSIFDGVVGDGVFATIGASLMVTPGTGLQVLVGIGRAWFNHTWLNNDSSLPITISAPDELLNRIDSIILEVDATDTVRENSIKVLTGTPASSPAEPALTNTATKHQYRMANIAVNVGQSSFIQSDITNKIGTSECPFVTALLDTVDTDTIISQWNSQFATWFDHIKDHLTTDPAGNLQTQIDALPSKGTGTDVATGTDDNKYVTPKAIKDSKNVPNAVPGTVGNELVSNGTDWISTTPPVQDYAMDGRLTLLTAVPVTAEDQASKSTIYLTPYIGNKIHLWNGSGWVNYVLSEISASMPTTMLSSRSGTSTIGSYVLTDIANTADIILGMYVVVTGVVTGFVQSKTSSSITLDAAAANVNGSVTITFPCPTTANYDVFCYHNGSALALELKYWTTDSARWLALALQDGVYVLAADHTRRYIGTVRFVSSVTHDTFKDRLVWNYYNRVHRYMKSVASGSHTYSSANWRLWNNSSTYTLSNVIGIAEDAVLAYGIASWSVSGTGQITNFSIGIDSTTVPNDDVKFTGFINTMTNIQTPVEGVILAAGYHTINLLENYVSGTSPSWTAGGIFAMLKG